MKKVVLFGHNGSGNHGCEALVRTTVGVMREAGADDITLLSTQPNQDEQYISDLELNVRFLGSAFEGISVKRLLAKLSYLTTHSYRLYDKQEMKRLFDVKNSLCIAIGGDNYCYSDFDRYSRMNGYLKEKNNTTVLWGCSISPELMESPALMADLKRYDLITARESLTYEALTNAGLTNVKFVPDTAFLLPCQPVELPFKTDKVVGINVSPLVMERETSEGMVQQSFEKMIECLLDTTDYEIAFIPHVHNAYSEDLDALKPLYEKYKASGRVYLIDEEKTWNCCQLKALISKLSFLVTARTHASIAAYSTGVPTLVIGYSVKSRGIAKDIFGEYAPYVCSVEEMHDGTELKKVFFRMMEQRDAMCETLKAYDQEVTGKFDSLIQTIKTFL